MTLGIFGDDSIFPWIQDILCENKPFDVRSRGSMLAHDAEMISGLECHVMG